MEGHAASKIASKAHVQYQSPLCPFLIRVGGTSRALALVVADIGGGTSTPGTITPTALSDPTHPTATSKFPKRNIRYNVD